MSSDRRRAIFFNKYRFMIWHILISESVSVYGRYAVGLLSVWVRDCRSAVGYDSSIVLMVGFHSVSCRLSIGLRSGDPIPNLTRSDPGWFYGVFSNIVGGRQLADSLKILRFCRFRVGLAGVTGVLNWKAVAVTTLLTCHWFYRFRHLHSLQVHYISVIAS